MTRVSQVIAILIGALFIYAGAVKIIDPVEFARILFRRSVCIVTAMMSLFIVASIVANTRGLDVSCGCFGHASKYLDFSWHLALDFLLLGGLLLLWKRPAAVA